jgi:hypothetical protein
MNDHRDNEFFKKRRAEIEMYNAGVTSGITFATMKILSGIYGEDLNVIIERLIKEYHE